MTIVEVRGRVLWQACHYRDSVRDEIIKDFDQDCELMQARKWTASQVAAKWSDFIGLKIKF